MENNFDVKEALTEQRKIVFCENCKFPMVILDEVKKTYGCLNCRIEIEDQRPFPFDLNEGLRSGLFIAGGKGIGKTNLGKQIAEIYLQHGHIVKVFDISQQWLKSSLPYYQVINQDTTAIDIDFNKSCVFDLSLLYAEDIKQSIAKVVEKEFLIQAQLPEEQRHWHIYFFEEAQMLVPQNRLKSKEAQELLRLMTVGRNFKLGYVLLTQRPATVDTTAIELCYQRYFGRCDGENDLSKIENWIRNRIEELPQLKIGEFLYNYGQLTERIQTPLFRNSIKPKQIVMPKPVATTPTIPTTLQYSNVETRVGQAIIWVAWLCFLIWLLAR